MRKKAFQYLAVLIVALGLFSSPVTRQSGLGLDDCTTGPGSSCGG